MICKNCNTEFDTRKVKPGESIRCPRCGKVYQRKAGTAPQSTKTAQKRAAKPKTKARRTKKKSVAGLVAALFIMIFLSLVAIAGITTYRFAPTLFHKVTFGIFDRNREVRTEEVFVLQSNTESQYERTGEKYVTTSEYTYLKNGLVQELHQHTEGFSDVYYEYSYEYNDQGYPVTVTRIERSSGYSVVIALDSVLDEDNVLNVYYLNDGTNQISYDFYSNSSLFSNANLYSDNVVRKYRNGERVYNYELMGTGEHETTVDLLPDGTRVETKSSANTEQMESKKSIVMALDADKKILHLACYQMEKQTGYAAVSYFREKNPAESGSVLHGIVTEASGLLEYLIGGDIVQYIYSDDDVLLREDRFVIGDVGTKNGWHLYEEPTRQITYTSAGTVIKDEQFYYFDDGLLGTKVSSVYAPLSEVLAITQSVAEEADANRMEPSLEAAVTETDAPEANYSDYQQPAQETEAPTSATATPVPTSVPTATPAPTLTSAPTATPTPKPTQAPEPKAATILHCNNAANVRSEPDSGSKKLGSLAWGKHITVIGQVGNWSMIEYKGGVAYVFSEYVAIHHTGTIVKVNNYVNVWAQPDDDYDHYARINKGKTVEVIEIDGDWAMILYKGDIAYIHSKYVQLDD